MTQTAGSPFAYLVQSVTHREPPARYGQAAPADGTHTAQLLRAPADGTHTAQLLRALDACGPLTSRELADATGLNTRLVWGLLKGPRGNGQVRFAAGRWELDRDYELSPAELRAAALLRGRGWTCQPPKALPADAATLTSPPSTTPGPGRFFT